MTFKWPWHDLALELCQISSYLFIIAVERLATNIREKSNIKGIRIGDSEIKLIQLADETCFVTDTDMILDIMKTCDTFKTCAEVKVNVNKTKIKFIGL